MTHARPSLGFGRWAAGSGVLVDGLGLLGPGIEFERQAKGGPIVWGPLRLGASSPDPRQGGAVQEESTAACQRLSPPHIRLAPFD